MHLSANYVREYLAKLITQKTEIIEGPIKAHDCALIISKKPLGVLKSGFLTHIRGDGKRFIVRADEKLTAFIELEAAIPSRSFHLDRSR